MKSSTNETFLGTDGFNLVQNKRRKEMCPGVENGAKMHSVKNGNKVFKGKTAKILNLLLHMSQRKDGGERLMLSTPRVVNVVFNANVNVAQANYTTLLLV